MKPAAVDIAEFMQKVSWEIDVLERAQPVTKVLSEGKVVGKPVFIAKRHARNSDTAYFVSKNSRESGRVSFKGAYDRGTDQSYHSLVKVGGAQYKPRKGKEPWTKKRQRQRAAINHVVASATHPSVRDAICAVLSAAAKDAHEISKAITPTLLPLALIGTIPISPTPIAFAALAIFVARMGVTVFCGSSKGHE